HPPRAHRVGRARPASPLARPRPLGSRLSRAAAHAGAPARGAPAAGLGPGGGPGRRAPGRRAARPARGPAAHGGAPLPPAAGPGRRAGRRAGGRAGGRAAARRAPGGSAARAQPGGGRRARELGGDHGGRLATRRGAVAAAPAVVSPRGPARAAGHDGGAAHRRRSPARARGGTMAAEPPRSRPGRPGRQPRGRGTVREASDGPSPERRAEVTSKFVFVTGGVISSVGKGLAAASIGSLLEARGFRVTLLKLDPYINVDAGTMSPYQHGEVYVTDDGGETDLDLGHYERFTSARMSRDNN